MSFNHQTDSPLFTIPAETRQLIYSLLIPKGILYIELCTALRPSGNALNGSRRISPVAALRQQFDVLSSIKQTNGIHLLLVCQWMRLEALELLASVTVRFHCPECFNTFLPSAARGLGVGVEWIKSVEIVLDLAQTNRFHALRRVMHRGGHLTSEFAKTMARGAMQSRVADFYSRSIPFRIYHGNTNSTRRSSRTTANSLDVSSLNRIVSINPSTRTCICEPNVPMDTLLLATIKHNLMPPVVPEFPGITVGGAFAGTGGESSSFKYGFFDRSVTAIEMILADGTVTTADASTNSDLFHGSASTFGTLGVLTLLHLTLIRCKPYVELTYHPVKSISAARPSTLPALTTFHNASDEWFYLHAQRHSDPATHQTSSTPHRDLIPLESYIFRFDRGAFWMGRFGFKYFLVPFTRTTRRLLDPFLHTRVLYHGLHSSGLTEDFIIQDLAVPASKMAEFSEWLDCDHEAGCGEIYPRWLCPLMDHHQQLEQEAVGGKVSGFTMNPRLAKAAKKGDDDVDGEGSDFLLNTFYTEDEFWQIYDRNVYEGLRKNYRAESLPSVYDKVGPKTEILKSEKEEDNRARTQGHSLWSVWDVWPLKGLYGLMSVVKGGDYLRKGK
ncbi:hypothetical protein DV736_g4718, partial [Chaetothyriales sp. CBS 134916]